MKFLVINKESSLTRDIKQMSYNRGVCVVEATSAAEAIECLSSRNRYELVIVSMASVWSGGNKWKEIVSLCGKRQPCIFIPDVREITAISGVIMHNQVVCPIDTPAGKKVFAMLITGVIERNVRLEKCSAKTASMKVKQREKQDDSVPHFTRRQREVLDLMVVGKTNREIASELNVAEGTVKLHSLSIYRSLGVSNRVQAVLRGQQLSFD